ncbi:PREDICTED: uncharacterized protein LOC105450321 [Wasmannia auropunctata]|uniref:uncharacterized protein LOC105450321 n=1 Tax=Wasmannia auropunctata TaxID=64793 RepID=UPI0005ED7BDA|nr:PREDICTED: uncharacterized protein LOC105450321 [Wasmannia auropunctata]
MENNVKCFMCSVVCVSNDDLIRHTVRFHRLDPRFQVQCKHDGCGATFHKWKLFRQHIWRNHGNNGLSDVEHVERDIYFPDIDLMQEENNHQNDDAGYDESIMTALEQLQWHAAKFLLGIRENCKISQTAIERVIEGVQHFDVNLFINYSDGSAYRENEFFRSHPNSLAIILYYDDLGVANPLGVSSKNQKLSMFYWTLGNIHPKERSSKNAIQLLAIVKTESLKKDRALGKLLEPFIQDIIKLRTEGVTINVRGNDTIFKGSLLFCCADTPAAALMRGFKESVSAHRLCLSEPNVSNYVSKFWKRRYGVNSRSPLLDIPDFDVTVGLPQDAMHILLEADIPAVILREHLVSTDSKLRQTAAQMFALAHVLPFLIAESIIDEQDRDICVRLLTHTHLLQILNMCLAYEIHDQSVDFLSHMIQLYIRRFILLYPDCAIPKMHFLLHIPRCIRLFGPARQQWCLRFESAHAYYKQLVPVVRNVKNMAYTCAYRHQANLYSKLATYSGESTKFLYQGHEISPGDTVLLNNLPNDQLFHKYLTEAERINCQLLRIPKVKIHGTTYVPKSLILLQNEEEFLPVFGEVRKYL